MFATRFSDFPLKLSSCNYNRDMEQHKLSLLQLMASIMGSPAATATATGMGQHNLLLLQLQFLLVTETATDA